MTEDKVCDLGELIPGYRMASQDGAVSRHNL